MGKDNEAQLRGANLEGSDRVESVDHVEYAKKRNPDAELHLDGETDTLYHDGLDIEDESLTLADTKNMSHRG